MFSEEKWAVLSLKSEVQGTVPYLGTFLTDLTMIDEALPDRTEGNHRNLWRSQSGKLVT